MKKIIQFALFVFLLSFGYSNAAYLTNVPQTITQPDGKKIECFATGDEFFNWVHTKEGYTIIQNIETGKYYYAQKLKNGRLAPSKYLVGSVEPSKTGLALWLKPDDKIIQTETAEMRASQRASKPVRKGYESTLGANVGTLNNLVIFVRFYDEVEYTQPITYFESQFNVATGNSMKSYFKEVSYNQLTINSSFYPLPNGTATVSYKDSHPRGYFQPYSATNTQGYTGGDNGSMRRDREHKLLHDAVVAVSAAIPPTLNLDYDNDGYVDNVCFIVSGSPNGWASLLWPHMWSLYTNTVSINGKQVWGYNFQILSMTGNSVLCHEMFHSLGSPDLYHYNYDGKTPVGAWDLMEQNANPPQYMGAWMKYKYGKWITTIPDITTTGTYTLNPLSSATNNSYKINPSGGSQFFVVEYRKQAATNFESSLPGSGLLVYRINNTLNGNASGPPDEVYLFRPGGTSTANGTISQAFFSQDAGRTGITDVTDPVLTYADGTFPGFTITQVSSPGSTISFKVTFGNSAKDVVLLNPYDGDGYTNLSPSFSWIGVDGATNYNLQVATDYAFSNIILNTNTTNTNFNFTGVLPRFTRYYWRVKATIPDVTTTFSKISTFKTIPSLRISNLNSSFCGGSKATIAVTVDTLFKPDNQFIVELSDGLGNFNYGKTIGIVESNMTGVVEAALPEATPYGSKYRIRVKATNPVFTSNDNGTDLTIYPKPTASLKNLKSDVCINDVVEYSYEPAIGSTYYWEATNCEVVDKSVPNKYKVKWNNIEGGSIKLVQKNVNGCLDSVYTLINVFNNPKVNIIFGDKNPCPGQKFTYIATSELGTVNTWSIVGGKITNDKDNSKIDVIWSAGEQTYVKVINTNSAGCTDSVIYPVQVTPLATSTITGNDKVCLNVLRTYKASKKANEKITWSQTGGTLVGPNNLDSVQVKWNGANGAKCELTMTVKNTETSCEGVLKMPITIIPDPQATITGETNVCEIVNTVYKTNMADCKSVKWSVSNGAISGPDNLDSVLVSWTQGTGKLSLEKTNEAGCINSTNKDVYITSAPYKPTITNSNDTLFSTFKKFNLWYKDEVLLAGENGAFLVAKSNGFYRCAAKNDNNCVSTMSEKYEYIKNNIEIENANGFNIYPNPTTGDLFVELPTGLNEEFTIQIFDGISQNVANYKFDGNSSRVTLNLKDLPAGAYSIRLQSTSTNFTKSFIRVK